MATRSPRASLEERCREAGYPGALINCHDFVLSTLGSAITDLLDSTLAPFGLRMRSYRMLRILDLDGPQRQSALGALVGLDRTTTVQLIDELEAAGLAKRERSSTDRRSYLVSLTAKGRRTIAKAIARVDEAESRMFGPLAAGELRALHDLAARLLTEPGTIAESHRREHAALMKRGRS